ncbi:MAG: phosphoribosyltransferase family protein [Roseovarius sp.]
MGIGQRDTSRKNLTMITINGELVTPTIFPDGTQQVWKLRDVIGEDNIVRWDYDGDHEIVTLWQLSLLANNITLYCDFLPYGRQDKEVSNEFTFGLTSFIQMLAGMGIKTLVTIDAHSEVPKRLCREYGVEYYDIYPEHSINYALNDSNCDMVCYPDKGASKRYKIDLPSVILDKVRDQSTGEIVGLKVIERTPQEHILIIDDICDGGRTFCESAKLLKTYGATVDLYITHGIFSKGTGVLYASGIGKIYTKDGIVP